TTVKISKSESKAQDEILELGKDKYRFNGMRWILWQGDEIFLHLDTFEATGEQGLIEISNRGEFGSRVLVSLGFPDITAKDMAQKIKLTKDIPTVRLYPPGTPVHKNGGGQIRLHYPLLEIRKDTLNKNGKIRLPLFLQDARQLYLRAVYYQRGKLVHWPSNSGAGIAKDGQDYFAVVR
ncbi:MAG: hypothetical protein NZL89_05760, partial [Leptospiraceae bacterium]|nr:hypothetical protein [Leptospiraceae bacterium]